ncbi:DUF6059 family protein [Kitasatospora viridis]|uniref:Uncharacterized protein n=1 Tax=Kitasatospora viridis TaxID=281105 RepID=A0A561ULQ7_9ACTN|nr:DUF6059 family protein [Kitasatospora viridis]TWG00316.1 hypothetical protein FHX73_114191 [Kitasatospora viridis]
MTTLIGLLTRLLIRLLGWVLRTLAGYGSCLGLAPEPEPQPRQPSLRTVRLLLARRGAGPPARHPERLRPDLPLTPVERRLDRELRLESEWF